MELRTTLDEELTEKFKVVKEHIGMKSNRNIIRFLISSAYDKIQETRYRKVFVAPETYGMAEKEAEARGQTVDIYVQELMDDTIRKSEEGVKHGKQD